MPQDKTTSSQSSLEPLFAALDAEYDGALPEQAIRAVQQRRDAADPIDARDFANVAAHRIRVP